MAHKTGLVEQILEGGGRTHVTRQGPVVYREVKPWTPSIHALLQHLAEANFGAAPHLYGSGYDGRGRETLQYIEGEFVHPGVWSDEALAGIGQKLRQLHDVSKTFGPPLHATWQPWFLRDLGGEKSVIGHGDLAPWNTITQNGLLVAFIDWEYAGPMDPLVELARVCWLFPQLHDDDVAERVGLPPLATRLRQLRALVDAYGLEAQRRSDLFDSMLQVAVFETANDAIENNVQPESEGALWGLAWRARAAAWMLRHRRLIEQALT